MSPHEQNQIVLPQIVLPLDLVAALSRHALVEKLPKGIIPAQQTAAQLPHTFENDGEFT